MTPTPAVEGLLAQCIAASNSCDLDVHMEPNTVAAMLFGSVDEMADGHEAVCGYFSPSSV